MPLKTSVSWATPGKKIGPRQGAVVIWPSGVQERYGISAQTLWRWEKLGRLPPRDISIGGKTGWRPATLEALESTHPRFDQL